MSKSRKPNRVWSDKEIEYIKRNCGIISFQKMAEKLNSRPGAIHYLCCKLGLKSKLTPAKPNTIDRVKQKFDVIDEKRDKNGKIKVKCPYCSKIFKKTPCDLIYDYVSCGCLSVGGQSGKIYHKKRLGTKNISKGFFSYVKLSAKYRNIKFEITIEQLEELIVKQNFKCALSNRDICIGYQYLGDMTGSLDRIDSTGGYTIDNIQFVHKLVNVAKRSMHDNEFISLCKDVAKNAKQRKYNIPN